MRPMRLPRRLSILLLPPLLAACAGESLSPRALVGRWQFTAESSAGGRRDDIRLTLAADGTFLRTHAVFADDGRAGDHLRSHLRVEGTYTVDGGRMIVEVARAARWEHLPPPPGEPEAARPGVYAGERYHVRLVGDLLLMEESRLVDGQPVTYHHTFRRLDETDG